MQDSASGLRGSQGKQVMCVCGCVNFNVVTFIYTNFSVLCND